MLHTKRDAKRIVRDAMRGADGDMLGHLPPVVVDKHPFARTAVFVPTADSVPCRRTMLFLIDQLPGLVVKMDRLVDEEAKLDLARTTLTKWNQAFHRLVKQKAKSNNEVD